MVICPSCGSSRIRNDYKPAPFILRMIGIRALLCDNCNFPFRAFSPLPPKSRRPRHLTRKADVFNPAPPVNLSELKQEPLAGKPELKLVLSMPESQSNSLQGLKQEQGLLTAQPVMRNASDLAVPVRTDLRTEITRLQTRDIKKAAMDLAIGDSASEPSSQSNRGSSSQICPECDSQNVRRRHRNLVERAILSVTDHKPYVCRNCGASFYAKNEDEAREVAVGSNEAA